MDRFKFFEISHEKNSCRQDYVVEKDVNIIIKKYLPMFQVAPLKNIHAHIFAPTYSCLHIHDHYFPKHLVKIARTIFKASSVNCANRFPSHPGKIRLIIFKAISVKLRSQFSKLPRQNYAHHIPS